MRGRSAGLISGATSRPAETVGGTPLRPVVAVDWPTALTRWAVAVTEVARADRDLPNLKSWARYVNLGRATLCNRCRLVGAASKASLNIGRLTRTLLLGSPDEWRPEHWLDIADQRTLNSLLGGAGLLSYHGQCRPPLESLFLGQKLLRPRLMLCLRPWLDPATWVRRTGGPDKATPSGESVQELRRPSWASASTTGRRSGDLPVVRRDR